MADRQKVRSVTKAQESEAPNAIASSQTLVRGLSVLDAVASGATDLPALSAALGMTRSTTHRLATALVERRYLNFVPREGYSLGPKLLELGFRAQRSMLLPRVARPYLDRLSEACKDTTHLGVLDGGWALYLDKIPGRRRIEISSRVGERHPVWSTGLGKALILDLDETRWRKFYEVGEARGVRHVRTLEGVVEQCASMQARASRSIWRKTSLRSTASPLPSGTQAVGRSQRSASRPLRHTWWTAGWRK